MLLPMEDAIAACRAHKEQVRFIDQFRRLVDELAQWVVAHQAKVKKAFVTTRDAGLLFVVERNEQAFDEAFEDKLIDLDLRIARNEQFNLIKLSFQPLPACSDAAIKSFLTPGKTIQIKIHG